MVDKKAEIYGYANMNKGSKLYEEAVEILRQSSVLKDTVDWLIVEVEKVCNRYTDDEVDALTWEEKEKHLRDVDELSGRLNESVRTLDLLDEQYEKLRVKVRKLYGKDYLPPLGQVKKYKIDPSDEIDLRG